MEKHSMLEPTEEQMFIYTVSMSRCCGPKVEKRPPNRWLPTPRWASQVAALRKLGTRAPGTAAISCRNSLEMFWQVVTSKMLSSEILRFQSVSTWCQLRHLMLRAVPVLSSSSEARARCASWVFRNTTLGNCFKFTRLLKLHAEFQQFNVVVSCCVLFKKHQIMFQMIYNIN